MSQDLLLQFLSHGFILGKSGLQALDFLVLLEKVGLVALVDVVLVRNPLLFKSLRFSQDGTRQTFLE